MKRKDWSKLSKNIEFWYKKAILRILTSRVRLLKFYSIELRCKTRNVFSNIRLFLDNV